MLTLGSCVVIRMGFFLDLVSMDTDASGNGIDFGPNFWLRANQISENGPFSNFLMFRRAK